MRSLKMWILRGFLTVTILILGFRTLFSSSEALTSKTELQSAGAITVDGAGFEMVYVPSGTVEMGITRQNLSDLLEQGLLGDIPWQQLVLLMNMAEEQGVFDTKTVTMHAFWIDRYEVTIEQYQSLTEYCAGTGLCSTPDLSEVPQLTADPNQPQIGVSWFDALRFCVGRGARLPTEAEWEYAASGPENSIFPWGNSAVIENLSANDTTYPVGSKLGNVSWAGVYDLAGNAAEWVEDRIQPYHPSRSEAFIFHGQSDVYRVVRGGDYRATLFFMTSFARDANSPVTLGEGFRCARSTDPGS